MKVRAKFKGKKPSLGYIPGEEYTLIVFAGVAGVSIIDQKRIGRPMSDSGHCPYKTLKSFLNNWEVIE